MRRHELGCQCRWIDLDALGKLFSYKYLYLIPPGLTHEIPGLPDRKKMVRCRFL